MNRIHTYSINLLLLFACIVQLTACGNEELTAVSTGITDNTRQLVAHEVSVGLDGATTRVIYQPDGNGLQLTWDASETLGVYIEKTDHSVIYVGTVSSTGTAGSRGTRTFTGTVSEKNTGEQYIYVHPAPTGETQGQTARGTINLDNQTGILNSATHLNNYIPLVWREGNSRPEKQGYAVHLTLSFNEDPGTINTVSLQTMPGTGTTDIFPTSFVASTMSAGATKTSAITLTTSGTATKQGKEWKADAYLASSNVDVNVFRTKFNVKVEATNGTFYNEFRSFPGQENATETLPMLANGNCHNLETAMSKDVAITIISEKYRVNSLLGMWDDYGKASDPLHLVAYPGGSAHISTADVPQQLKDNKAAIISRYNNNASGSPTWLGPDNTSLYVVGRPDVKQENVTFNNIRITEPTEVFVTFVSDFAWNRDLLGYYHYPTATESTVTSSQVKNTIIFPDVSKPNHEPFAKGEPGHNDNYNIATPAQAPLQEFETVKLLYTDANGYSSTIFPAGTTIGFMMMIKVDATTTTLMTWSQWRIFTNSVWNKENTTAHGASSNWPSTGYPRSNFFASGDVCNGSGNPIPGLAMYGVKDKGDNNEPHAYSAMMFMVSTSIPSAMQTANTAYFNIDTGDHVIGK